MTFPTGDRGQRYEVSYLAEDGERKVFGWANDVIGAEAMVGSINLHPSMSRPQIKDRERER